MQESDRILVVALHDAFSAASAALVRASRALVAGMQDAVIIMGRGGRLDDDEIVDLLRANEEAMMVPTFKGPPRSALVTYPVWHHKHRHHMPAATCAPRAPWVAGRNALRGRR